MLGLTDTTCVVKWSLRMQSATMLRASCEAWRSTSVCILTVADVVVGQHAVHCCWHSLQQPALAADHRQYHLSGKLFASSGTVAVAAWMFSKCALRLCTWQSRLTRFCFSKFLRCCSLVLCFCFTCAGPDSSAGAVGCSSVCADSNDSRDGSPVPHTTLDAGEWPAVWTRQGW
jgi:hypothetical protein